jgi:hypothetical protein
MYIATTIATTASAMPIQSDHLSFMAILAEPNVGAAELTSCDQDHLPTQAHAQHRGGMTDLRTTARASP